MIAPGDRARDEQPAETEGVARLWANGVPDEARGPRGAADPMAPSTAECPEGTIGGGHEPVCARCGADLTTAQPAPAGDDELREAVLDVVKAHGGTEDIADAERFVAEYDERGRELERLRRRADTQGRDLVRARSARDDYAAELERLRARDEAAAAVARLWDGTVYDTTNDNPLWAALDELARVHRDGGR